MQYNAGVEKTLVLKPKIPYTEGSHYSYPLKLNNE